MEVFYRTGFVGNPALFVSKALYRRKGRVQGRALGKDGHSSPVLSHTGSLSLKNDEGK